MRVASPEHQKLLGIFSAMLIILIVAIVLYASGRPQTGAVGLSLNTCTTGSETIYGQGRVSCSEPLMSSGGTLTVNFSFAGHNSIVITELGCVDTLQASSSNELFPSNFMVLNQPLVLKPYEIATLSFSCPASDGGATPFIGSLWMKYQSEGANITEIVGMTEVPRK